MAGINPFQYPSWSKASTPTVSDSSASRYQTGAAADSTEVLLNKLAEQIPGMSAQELADLKADEFTADKVAGRISDFVASGLAAARARGASEDALNSMYEAALAGTKQGFAQARDILDSLGVLQGTLASQIDETERLTFDALAALAPGEAVSQNSSAQLVLDMSERFRSAETMQLSVTTQDGDEVTLSFSRQSAQDAAFSYASDGQGNRAASFSLSRSESSVYQFSINGDLDSAEQEALMNLVQDITTLADEFFSGDLQSALQSSSALRFDATELSSLQLDLSYSRSYASSTRYQQVQQLDQGEDKPGRRLGQLMKELAQSAGAPSLGFLSAPGQMAGDLFAGLVGQDTRLVEASTDQQTLYRDGLSRLLEALGLTQAEQDSEPASQAASELSDSAEPGTGDPLKAGTDLA